MKCDVYEKRSTVITLPFDENALYRSKMMKRRRRGTSVISPFATVNVRTTNTKLDR